MKEVSMKANTAFSDRPRYLKMGMHETHWHVPFRAHRIDPCNFHNTMHMDKFDYIIKSRPIRWKADLLHAFSLNSSIKGRM